MPRGDGGDDPRADQAVCVALGDFPADRFLTWPLTRLKLERDPVSAIWKERNAAIRPAVATLAEAMSSSLAF